MSLSSTKAAAWLMLSFAMIIGESLEMATETDTDRATVGALLTNQPARVPLQSQGSRREFSSLSSAGRLRQGKSSMWTRSGGASAVDSMRPTRPVGVRLRRLMQLQDATRWAEGAPRDLPHTVIKTSVPKLTPQRSVAVQTTTSMTPKLGEVESTGVKGRGGMLDEELPPGFVRQHTGGNGDGLRFMTATDRQTKVSGEYLGGLSINQCAAQCNAGCAGLVHSAQGGCQLVDRIFNTSTQVDAISLKKTVLSLAGAAMESAKRQALHQLAIQSGNKAAIAATTEAAAVAQAEVVAAKRLALSGELSNRCTTHGPFNSSWYIAENPEVESEVGSNNPVAALAHWEKIGRKDLLVACEGCCPGNATTGDCILSEWHQWAGCSTGARGRGSGKGSGRNAPPPPAPQQRRERTVLRGSVHLCGHLSESKPCPACIVSSWTLWGNCDSGLQYRNRSIIGQSTGGCGSLQESQRCAECQVDPWSEWGSCTGSGGTQSRVRTVSQQPVGNESVSCPDLNNRKDCGGVSVDANAGRDLFANKGEPVHVSDGSATGSWSLLSTGTDAGAQQRPLAWEPADQLFVDNSESNVLPSVAIHADQSCRITLAKANVNPAVSFQWTAGAKILLSRLSVTGILAGNDTTFVKVYVFKDDQQVLKFSPGTQNGNAFGVSVPVQQGTVVSVRVVSSFAAPETVAVKLRLFVSTNGRPRQYAIGEDYLYEQAIAFCSHSSQQLCNQAQYCPPNAQPAFVAPQQLWSPIADEVNDWVQMGSHHQCASYVAHYGNKPKWGVQSQPSGKKGSLLCCPGQAANKVYSTNQQKSIIKEAADAAAAEQEVAARDEAVSAEFELSTADKESAQQASRSAQQADEASRQSVFNQNQQLLEIERQHKHKNAMWKSAKKLWTQLHKERNITDAKLAAGMKTSAELTASAATITADRNAAIARFNEATRDREDAYAEYSRPDSTEEDEARAHEAEKEAEEAGTNKYEMEEKYTEVQVQMKQTTSLLSHFETDRARQEAQLRAATLQEKQALGSLKQTEAVLKPAEVQAKELEIKLDLHKQNVTATSMIFRIAAQKSQQVSIRRQKVRKEHAEDSIRLTDATQQQAIMRKLLAQLKLSTLDKDLQTASVATQKLQTESNTAGTATAMALQRKTNQAQALALLKQQLQVQMQKVSSEVLTIQDLRGQQQLLWSQLKTEKVRLEQAQLKLEPTGNQLSALLEEVAVSSSELREVLAATAQADMKANETHADMERAKGVLAVASALVEEAEKLVANTTESLVLRTQTLQQVTADNAQTQATMQAKNQEVLRNVMQKQATWAKEKAAELQERVALLRHTEQQAKARAAANRASEDAMNKWQEAQASEQRAEQDAARAAMEAAVLEHKRQMADRLNGGCFVMEYCCPTRNRCCDSPKARTIKLQEKATWVDQALCYEAARKKRELCKSPLPVMASFLPLQQNRTFQELPCAEGMKAPRFSIDPSVNECFEPLAGAAGGAKYCTAQSCEASLGVLVDSVTVLNEGTALTKQSSAQNVLEDSGRDDDGSSWLGADGASGWFVLNLGVTASLRKIVIKGTHNGDANDRGTESFTLSVSSDAALWSDVLHGTLPDMRGVNDCIEPSEFVLESFGPTQYIKFKTDSYFGKGAGLNYLGLFTEPQLTGTRIRTIDIAVSRGADDATESSNGKVSTKVIQLSMGDKQTSVMVAIRFENVDLPQGANIEHAILKLRPDRIATGSSALTIHGELSPNSAEFDMTQNTDISRRPQTTNLALWSPAAWSQAGVGQETAELRGIIQEVVRQEGWQSGNSMTLLVNGLGHRDLSSYEGNSQFAPSLHVEYQGVIGA